MKRETVSVFRQMFFFSCRSSSIKDLQCPEVRCGGKQFCQFQCGEALEERRLDGFSDKAHVYM